MSKDYGYFGSGDSGYHQYMTAHDRNFGDSRSTEDSSVDLNDDISLDKVNTTTKTTKGYTGSGKPKYQPADTRPLRVQFMEWFRESKKEDPFRTWLVALTVVGYPALLVLLIVLGIILHGI